MKRASPQQAGYTPSAPLPASGRAARWQCGDDSELWRFAPDPTAEHDVAARSAEEALAGRLLSLGSAGVGGFVDGGAPDGDADVWLVRRLAGRPLADRVRAQAGPWPFREALGVGLGIARALAACERGSLFPGPLSPDTVLVDEGGTVTLPAASLVAAMVGAPRLRRASRSPLGALDALPDRSSAVEAHAGAARVSQEISPLWTPPAQADGEAWDNAANRYVLGLVLYRLIAGEHPFSGAGLRYALGEAAHREAPPFVERIATSLPGGLQSHILRMIDPDPSRRPPRADAIEGALRGFLEDAPNGQASRDPAPRRAPERARIAPDPLGNATPVAGGDLRGRRPDGRGGPTRASGGLRRYAPLAAGAAIALGALALTRGAPDTQARQRPPIAPKAPLTQRQTAAADCAACHGRQAAEWRRSVMAHAAKSPLFNALESLIEEQVGRDAECPNGAGILRKVDPARACRDRQSGIAITGSGGEHWCVNCHSPAENLDAVIPAWDGRAGGDPRARLPVRDLITQRGLEGISCGFCHQVHGPVGPRSARGYQGNPTWTSFTTGTVFASRPEDARGFVGIANSGYDLRADELLLAASRSAGFDAGAVPIDAADPIVHGRPSSSAKAYLRSSEFCGACHDVRLFGTDSLGASRGEHFKRLRNAYSEWSSWAKSEERAGRRPATCQDCHMSAYPGLCVTADVGPATAKGQGGDPECPPGTRFAARGPGTRPRGRVADDSAVVEDVVTHYFSGVDVPLSDEFPDALIDEPAIDLHGIPTGARHRRDLLLRHTFRFGLGASKRLSSGSGAVSAGAQIESLEIPIDVENTGAGHRVPAGFSQEREFWVHLVVKDGSGRVVYEVGRVDRRDEDLRDKVFVRVNTRADDVLAPGGAPVNVGLFGADIRDGPDVPRWSPSPLLGGTSFRGRGLINFQNGFLRCVRCIGEIAPDGSCAPGPGQGVHHADRFADGDYDPDTGACGSNLSGPNAFIETYFPVGALDASRGVLKGPDAIIDTRSVPPGVPLRYTYELPTGGRRGPFHVEARLLFRAFPPFLIRAFAAYEREQTRRGLRPSGPLVTDSMLARLEVVELARAETDIR